MAADKPPFRLRQWVVAVIGAVIIVGAGFGLRLIGPSSQPPTSAQVVEMIFFGVSILIFGLLSVRIFKAVNMGNDVRTPILELLLATLIMIIVALGVFL